MKFQVSTLVDITETGARKGTSDKFSYNQQQNFQTLIQTIGLRANLEYVNPPSVTVKTASQFGKDYKGEQKVWQFEFEVAYEQATSVQALQEDFDLVPFIDNLDETVNFTSSVFRTGDAKQKNIIFKHID